jgi:hypothetical protein
MNQSISSKEETASSIANAGGTGRNDTDLELVKHAQGDAEAFAALFHAHSAVA